MLCYKPYLMTRHKTAPIVCFRVGAIALLLAVCIYTVDIALKQNWKACLNDQACSTAVFAFCCAIALAYAYLQFFGVVDPEIESISGFYSVLKK